MIIFLISVLIFTQAFFLVYFATIIGEKNILIEDMQQIIGIHEGANATLVQQLK